jgi:2'-5' RNA ligase
MNDEPRDPDSPSTPPLRKQKRLRRATPPQPVRLPEETIDTARRLFLAAPIPPPVTALVDRTIGSLRDEPWPVKWNNPGNAHITLHFLGEIDPARADLLRMALHAPIEQHPAFELRTADLGVFPTMKRPRVIWLGLYGPAHRLHTIQEAIGATLRELEFEVEEREFHPHITLGRVRSERNTKIRDLPLAIRQRLERAAETGEVSSKDPIPLPIEEILLVRSHLGPSGPRYETIERYPLAPALPPK